MSGCLGEVAAALVDGELDHATRERALRHLTHCDACRADVEAQRRLKSSLSVLEAPTPSDALTARLRSLEAPPVAHVPPTPARSVPVRPAPARAAARRPSSRAGGPTAPAGRPRRSGAARRRAAAGSAIAALGLATALVLGGPPQRPASTPVDPGADAFVAEFVDTANDDAGSVVTPVSVTGASTTGGPRSAR